MDRDSAGPERMGLIPGPVRRALVHAVLLACLAASSGCTVLLAGAIAHKIIKTVTTKKTEQGKELFVHMAWIEDKREDRLYMVEVQLAHEIKKKEGVISYTVEKAIINYEDKKWGKIQVQDRDGDSFIETILLGDQEYGPPAPYNSKTYSELQKNGELNKEDPDFVLKLSSDNPWFDFLLKTEKESETGIERLDAYPYQENFTSVVVMALRNLSVDQLKIHGS